MTKEAQEKIEAAKRRAEEEIARVEREEALKDLLPVRPDSAYSHGKGEASVTYRGEGPRYSSAGLPLAEVLSLLEKIPPLERIHRRAGCLSIAPDGWAPRYADAPEEYRSRVGITIEGGRGFGPSVTAEWSAEVGGMRCTVRAELPAFLPGIRAARVGVTYNNRGEVANPGRVEAADIPGAKRIQWASGSPEAFRVSWYWSTLAGFAAWTRGETIPDPYIPPPRVLKTPTRDDYMEHRVSHSTYYRAIAETAGVSFRGGDPAFLARVREALAAGDEPLNTIPIRIWDGMASRVDPAAFREHGDHASAAGFVCVLKQAARDAAEEVPAK